MCAPVADPKEGNVEIEKELEEKRKKIFAAVQGEPLTEAERKHIVGTCLKHNTRKQINLGREGLTHNMLNDVHNNWKHSQAVRIKCMGVPTVDMKNVCDQLEDKTFGKILSRRGGYIYLYRGRNYIPKRRDVVPLMLWKPHHPVYPKLIKMTIDGLSIKESRAMKRLGRAVPVLTKLAKNGYYGNLVSMVRDAFLCDELVRIDCTGLQKSDYRKIGRKLRDLVPCILVSFEREQIVVWRGKDYKPIEKGFFFSERETLNNPDSCTEEKHLRTLEAKD